ARQEAGFDVRWLEGKDVRREFGFDAPAAILSHHGAEANAYQLMHTLMQKFPNHPVFDRTKILSATPLGKGMVATTSTGHKIRAKKVVYATGYEVVEVLDKPIVKLLSTYALASEHQQNLRAWKGSTLLWNTADPYLYIRATADGRIIVGGRDEEFYSPAKRDKLIKRKSVQLVNDFKKLYPEIDLVAEFSWAGTFGSTKDGLPFIGVYDKMPNSYFALGFGGNGITFSQVAAKLLVDLYKGIKNSDLEIFSFDRE
ncbi:MAG TPA: FAD-binding oxidoreductase, partial [Flavobacterium sp.]|nr:FAD-binding oxidoreductase [Flavobacterium sp.]